MKDFTKAEEGWIESLNADTLFKRRRLFMNDQDQLIYKCCNLRINAALTDTDWYIWKYAYTGTIIDIEGERRGAVDSEPTGLGWNI